MENYLKQTKRTCVKYRFASTAHKYRLTSPPKFDMLIMLGGRMAVSFLQQKRPPQAADLQTRSNP